MTATNPFAAAQAYLQATKAPPPQPTEDPGLDTPKKKMLWRVITESEAIQQRLVDMVNELGDADYGEEITHFAGQPRITAAVTQEMAMEIYHGTDPDYVLLYRPGRAYDWSLSERYSRGDFVKYFGKQIAGRYKTAMLNPLTKKGH